MNTNIRKVFQALLFMAIGVVIMCWVYLKQAKIYQAECSAKGIPQGECSLIEKIFTDMSQAKIFWIVVSMLIFVLSNIIRAFRWRMMFRAIGYNPAYFNLLGAIFINYLANLGIPRSGEVIRGTVISRYEDIPLDKALGTIVLDRVLDAIMFALFLVASLIFGGKVYIDYLHKNTNFSVKFSVIYEISWLVWFSVGLILIGIAAFIFSKRKSILSSNLGQKLIKLFKGFAEGIRSISTVEHPVLFVLQTIGIWACFFIMLHVMFFAFDPTAHLGVLAALIVFVFGSLGMLIPSPGGMGAYHYLISEGLQLNGVGSTDGFTFANILFFSIQVGITLICGILALVAMPLLNKK